MQKHAKMAFLRFNILLNRTIYEVLLIVSCSPAQICSDFCIQSTSLPNGATGTYVSWSKLNVCVLEGILLTYSFAAYRALYFFIDYSHVINTIGKHL